MKQIAAILFLLLFVFNIFGLFFAFKIRQSLIKKEIKAMMKKTIPDDQLTLIIQTPDNADDFEWEHSKEFRYHGEMYDIVKKETCLGGTIKYFCFADEQETSLIDSFSKTVSNTMDPSGKANDFAKKISQVLGFVFNLPESLSIAYFFNFDKLFFGNQRNIISCIPDILLPPPEII